MSLRSDRVAAFTGLGGSLRVESVAAFSGIRTIHCTSQYISNYAELSHQQTRVSERGMRRFKSMEQAQRFLEIHAAVGNLFNLGRHLDCRNLTQAAFASPKKATLA